MSNSYRRFKHHHILTAGIVAVLGAIAPLTVGFASALPSASPTVPYVLAGGEQLAFGQIGQPPYAFMIDAHGVTNQATGTLTFTPPQGTFGTDVTARVTCLIVRTNDAVVTGVSTSPGPARGQTIVAEIVNGGSPSSDLLRFSFRGAISRGTPAGCFTPNLAPAGNVTAAGIQIGGPTGG